MNLVVNVLAVNFSLPCYVVTKSVLCTVYGVYCICFCASFPALRAFPGRPLPRRAAPPACAHALHRGAGPSVRRSQTWKVAQDLPSKAIVIAPFSLYRMNMLPKFGTEPRDSRWRGFRCSTSAMRTPTSCTSNSWSGARRSSAASCSGRCARASPRPCAPKVPDGAHAYSEWKNAA